MEAFQNRTLDVTPADYGDLSVVAGFLVLLHGIERGGPREVGADHGRALRYLEHLWHSQGGRVYVARAADGAPCGALVLERDDVKTEDGTVEVWSAGGLLCTESAPRDAALLLMYRAAIFLRSIGQTVVCLSAATEKNKRRATYRALGFRKIASGRGAADYYAAKLAHVIPALEARLRRVS